MSVADINFIFSVGVMIKRIHHHGFLKNGNIILKKGSGGLFLIYLKQRN